MIKDNGSLFSVLYSTLGNRLDSHLFLINPGSLRVRHEEFEIARVFGGSLRTIICKTCIQTSPDTQTQRLFEEFITSPTNRKLVSNST